MSILDPPDDTMADRIEEKIRGMLLAEPALEEIQLMLTGELERIPVDLHPFLTIFLAMESEAMGRDGFGQETGFKYLRYDGYLSVEVLLKDMPGLADQLRKIGTRTADVPSYKYARRLTQAARQVLVRWGGLDGRRVEEDPVVSADQKEVTVELRMDTWTTALQRRPDSVSNRGNVEFHLYTRRQDY